MAAGTAGPAPAAPWPTRLHTRSADRDPAHRTHAVLPAASRGPRGWVLPSRGSQEICLKDATRPRQKLKREKGSYIEHVFLKTTPNATERDSPRLTQRLRHLHGRPDLGACVESHGVLADLSLSGLDQGCRVGRSEILFPAKRRGLCCVGGTLWALRGSGDLLWR